MSKCCPLFACVLGISAISMAHPHMFIDTRLEVRLSGNTLEGLVIEWYFDPMFTSAILMDFDADQDCAFNSDETMNVYDNAFSNLSDFDYFTFVNTGGSTRSPGEARDFSVFMDGQTLVYRFYAPMDMEIENGSFSVAIYDHTFYCDILYCEDMPVSITGPGSEAAECSIVENHDIEIQYSGSISVSRDDRDYSGMAFPQQLVVTLGDN